jgi:hypothetical protein
MACRKRYCNIFEDYTITQRNEPKKKKRKKKKKKNDKIQKVEALKKDISTTQ